MFESSSHAIEFIHDMNNESLVESNHEESTKFKNLLIQLENSCHTLYSVIEVAVGKSKTEIKQEEFRFTTEVIRQNLQIGSEAYDVLRTLSEIQTNMLTLNEQLLLKHYIFEYPNITEMCRHLFFDAGDVLGFRICTSSRPEDSTTDDILFNILVSRIKEFHDDLDANNNLQKMVKVLFNKSDE